MTNILSVSERYYLIHWAEENKVSIHRDEELVEPAEGRDIGSSCVVLFGKTPYELKIACIGI